jgi:uncharacterized protein
MDTHAAGTGEVDFAKLFKEIKTIAVVGYSDNPERAGHYVAHYLASHGYEVLAINPRFKEQINGLACYANLGAIPAGKQVDVIDVFRSPEFVPQLVEEAAKLEPRPKYFWMQLGAENIDAAARCRELGITPVMNACMMHVHKELAR